MANFGLRFGAEWIPLSPGTFTIGRSSKADLPVDDEMVSRHHATLYIEEDGVEIEDAGSRNGIQVNGELRRGRGPLKHGDRLAVGEQLLVLIRERAS